MQKGLLLALHSVITLEGPYAVLGIQPRSTTARALLAVLAYQSGTIISFDLGAKPAVLRDHHLVVLESNWSQADIRQATSKQSYLSGSFLVWAFKVMPAVL